MGGEAGEDAEDSLAQTPIQTKPRDVAVCIPHTCVYQSTRTDMDAIQVLLYTPGRARHWESQLVEWNCEVEVKNFPPLRTGQAGLTRSVEFVMETLVARSALNVGL